MVQQIAAAFMHPSAAANINDLYCIAPRRRRAMSTWTGVHRTTKEST